MARLILLCGLPGAGKTTRARQLTATTHAILLSPDEWLDALGLSIFDLKARDRLEATLWNHAQTLLRYGQDVILDNGFWSRTERDTFRDTARALGATVHLHYLHAPLDTLKDRRRDLLTGEQLDEYAALFEPPDAAELATYDPPGPPTAGETRS
jgi:predicted kinase